MIKINKKQAVNQYFSKQKRKRKLNKFTVQQFILQMSEQILRNPKSIHRGGSYASSKHDMKENLSSMGLTRIKNPLASRFSSKQEKNVQSQVLKSSKENLNKNMQKQRPLKQPEYKFYADRFNASSDDSFMLDSSMRDSRKQKREEQIVEKFKNSRQEIQQLLKRSRERREQLSSVIAYGNYGPKDVKASVRKVDKKQEKRRRLKFYHCDSIIIKPEFHPTKVFDLAIAPTTHNRNPARFSFFPHNFQDEAPQQQADLSFQSNSKFETQKKSKNKRFLDSFNQSPLDKLNESEHHIKLQSPSFLDLNKGQSQSKYENRSFIKENSHEKKKIFSISEQQGKSNASNNFEKSSQQTIPTRSFKKRNKIFAIEKKQGLKLSRTIKYQEQINKLQGEMGVDVFHIVIEEEELLRHCCT